MDSLIRIALGLGLVACSSSSQTSTGIVPPAPKPGPVEGPGPITVPPGPLPGTPGPLNVQLSCVAPEGCKRSAGTFTQKAPYTMDFGGEDFLCRVTRSGNIILTIRNAQDRTDTVTLTLNAYGRPGLYQLDQAGARDISFSTSSPVENCRQGVPEGTFTDKGVPAQSPLATCSGCTVDIADPTPDAPFPKHLKFSVSCPSVCVSNDTYVCKAANGPIRFTVRPNCGDF